MQRWSPTGHQRGSTTLSCPWYWEWSRTEQKTKSLCIFFVLKITLLYFLELLMNSFLCVIAVFGDKTSSFEFESRIIHVLLSPQQDQDHKNMVLDSDSRMSQDHIFMVLVFSWTRELELVSTTTLLACVSCSHPKLSTIFKSIRIFKWKQTQNHHHERGSRYGWGLTSTPCLIVLFKFVCLRLIDLFP